VGFFYPANINAFIGLDLAYVVADALKRELRPDTRGIDLGFLNNVDILQPQRLDLVTQQLMHRVCYAVLELSNTKHPQRLLCAHQKQGSRKAPAFRPTSSTIGNLVALGLE
jgi:hypothetical protein